MSFSFTIPNTPSSKQTAPSGSGTFSFGQSQTQPTTSAGGGGGGGGFTFGAPTSSTSWSSFGQSQPGQSDSSKIGGGLFSSQQTQPSASSSGFTFGQPLHQPQQQPGSSTQQSFSQPTLAQQPSSFSFLQPPNSQPSEFSFGQQQPRGGSLMPQIPSAPTLFPRDTKFSELPTEYRASLESLEKVIRENALKSLQLFPPSKDQPKLLINFEGKLNEIEMMLTSRRENLRQVRKRMNEYWRYAESTGQQLLASKNILPDGRVVYKVPPMVPGIDVVSLERTVERLEEEVSTISRLGIAARKRLESLLAPSKPLENLIPSSIKSQHLAIGELESSLRDMELKLEEEKTKYKAFLGKYRNIFQDPFNIGNFSSQQSQQ
jgi:hypothetical protein